jgi:Pyruvate kinase, barrel domain
VADEMGVFIGILGDLRGPRIRAGEMENGSIELQRGKKIILTSENTVGTPAKIAVSFKGLHRDVAPGSIVLLDDGNIELQVLEIRATGDVVCEIVRGGELKSNKGVNLKNRLVSLPSLTTKDYQDLDFAVSEELDFLALSFVGSVATLQEWLDKLADMVLAPSVAGLFKWRQFEPEVILLAVGWYLRFSLSYRDVEELLAERGLHAPNALARKRSAAAASRLADRRKSTVAPVESTARYKYAHLPFTRM